MKDERTVIILVIGGVYFLWTSWAFLWNCVALYGCYHIYQKVDSFSDLLMRLNIVLPNELTRFLEQRNPNHNRSSSYV
jgi:hypothetical protein